MTRAVTDQTFGAVVLQSAKPAVVECWAQWCGPCRQLGPVLDAIATEQADKIGVVTLNVDENPETVQRYGIMLVPTMAVFSGVSSPGRWSGPGRRPRCCATSPTSSSRPGLAARRRRPSQWAGIPKNVLSITASG